MDKSQNSYQSIKYQELEQRIKMIPGTMTGQKQLYIANALEEYSHPKSSTQENSRLQRAIHKIKIKMDSKHYKPTQHR